MMEIFTYPQRKDWKSLLQRPYTDNKALIDTVHNIVQTVRTEGDEALHRFAVQWDGVTLTDIKVSAAEIKLAIAQVPDDLKKAIDLARQNIELFHYPQLKNESIIEIAPGIECWRKNVGIEKVGLYIPGGTAPLFSTVLMLGIPAAIAGCKRIVLCTPAGKDGANHPAILYAAHLVGITEIYKVGGAQAIAAMAFGTQTIPAVYKIFGPGNQYVTVAKQTVQQEGVAIDMPAGPSEVCILADDSANPVFIAADLLSQAEHGKDSQVMLVTDSHELVEKVMEKMKGQLNLLPRKELAEAALQNSRAFIVKDMAEGVALVNEYAAEHLILTCTDADALATKITNAGSVFIGAYSPESAGDYASGTNHTLPTAGFATCYSGVSVDSFVKKITYQKLTKEGLSSLGDAVMLMADAEGLTAHAAAIRVRLDDKNQHA